MANYTKPTTNKNDKNTTYKTAGLVILVLLAIITHSAFSFLLLQC